jgi:hypothetical protein
VRLEIWAVRMAKLWRGDAPRGRPPRAEGSGEKVGFDRKTLCRTLILAALLCWPMLVFGRPGCFYDTAGYYSGGRKAADFVVGKLEPHPPVVGWMAPAVAAPAAAPPAGGRDETAKQVRSIPYSVLAYLLGGSDMSMRGLIVFQALAAAFAATVFLQAFGVGRAGYWATAGLLAFATPTAWVASFAMPDIFAGLTILVTAILSFAAWRLTRPVLVTLGAIGALAISSHASHLLLALVLVPLALLCSALSSRRLRQRLLVSLPWVAGPAALAVLAVLAGGYLGFKEVSLAPKRLPFVLARSIGDGPGRWYLERHCATERYAVCAIYGDAIPRTSADFLFGPHGVNRRATPAQMEQLRREEPAIVMKATLAYPSEQLAASLGGVGRQLVSFGVDDEQFNARLVDTPGGGVKMDWDRSPPAAAMAGADALAEVTAILTFTWALFGLFRSPPQTRALVVFLLAAVATNAVLCAVLSAATDRYQSRVIWLILLAAAIVPAPWKRARRAPPLAA